jgi:uncharacterized protein HemY
VELADLALAVKHDRAAAAGFVDRALAPEGIDGLGGKELARAWALQGTLKALDHKPIEAQRAFEAALQASPASLPARLAFGSFLVERRSYEKAVELLRPAFEAAQGDLDVVRVWVRAQLGAGRYLEASKIVDGLAAARPNDAAALVLQAEVQLVTGKPKEAEKNLTAAAAKAPDSAAPLVALLAANTTEAMKFVNDHMGDFWQPGYRKYVDNLYNQSLKLDTAVKEYREYAKVRAKEERLQSALGLKSRS